MEISNDIIATGTVTYVKDTKTKKLVKVVTFDKPITVSEIIDVNMLLQEQQMLKEQAIWTERRIEEIEAIVEAFNEAKEEDIK